MKITIAGKEYLFLKNYQHDEKYRITFNQLAKNIFNGLSFEEWYRSGFWNDKYIPYTLFDEEKAIANLSVNIMNFNTFGEYKRYIQIGTVMTDERYRKRNLSRFLMEQALDDWNEKCDFMYLFANSSAVELYPKFGFQAANEYIYFKDINSSNPNVELQKLDMNEQKNVDLLYLIAKNSNPCSCFSMEENADLVLFYCTTFLKDNVYYIPSLDAICIAIYDNEILHLWDIFSSQDIDLETIIEILARPESRTISLGFTPKDNSGYVAKAFNGDDTLFVQTNKLNLFNNNQLMFPLISHA